MAQNKLAAAVRAQFPRSVRHPLVAMVTCMDARLVTNEIAGETSKEHYVLRLAGSVPSPQEEELLGLAANKGVEEVVFTIHSDCAAEKAAKNAEARKMDPNLATAVDQREKRFKEFLNLPAIASWLKEGRLMVKWVDLDTVGEHVTPHTGR